MSAFDEWLKESIDELSGAAPSGRAPDLGSGGELERLRKGLSRRIEKNESYFRIAFALAVLLALATLVAPFLPYGGGRAWVSAAFGISSAGAVAFALNAVREKHAFDVMLELATGLGEEALRDVLGVLARKVAGDRRAPARGKAPRTPTQRADQG
jgi:hypothetical protein